MTDQSGNIITSNVYAIEVAVWNSGDVSLGNLSDRVREPLSFSLSPDTVSIVDAVIQRTTLQKDLIQAVQQSPSLIQIKWGQFDPSDAFRILIIYAAAGQARFSIMGKFVGVSIIDRTDYNDLEILHLGEIEKLKSKFAAKQLRESILMFVGCMSLLTIIILLIKRETNRKYLIAASILATFLIF